MTTQKQPIAEQSLLRSILSATGKILKHPLTSLLAIALGISCAIFFKPIAMQCYEPGSLYLGLLKMCILPIIVSAIILSMGRLLRNKSSVIHLGRLFLVFICGMFLVVVAGFSSGFIFEPGSSLSMEQRANLGKEIGRAEAAISHDTPSTQKSILTFIGELIPENVFAALSHGKVLPVLIFCLFIGIALGKIETPSSNTLLDVAEALYEAMLRVISWLMYGLPLGLFCLFAGEVVRIGPGIFKSLFSLIAIVYGSSIALLTVYFLIISIRSRRSPLFCLRALKQTIIVALGTSSSLTALPFAIEGMHKRLGFDKQTTSIILPLGTTLNLHGNILYFALATVFMSQIYQVEPTALSWTITGVVTILVALAASNAPGISGLAMFAMILDMLGLPSVIGIIILTAIDPIVDPIITAVNVFGNCASSSIIDSPDRSQIDISTENKLEFVTSDVTS